ncbi:hypothetical protein Btru_068757 [Bulinus truncatus]|nr:hypothetical protein Btru_068757 [Bulinus truncatus]
MSVSQVNTTTATTADITNPRMVNGIVVLILMIINISGNGLVYYVYKYYFKRNIFTFFVKVLAALDLFTAFTTMLMDVIVKVRPLDERKLDLLVLCKLSHFCVYSSHLVCVCVLAFISYQRYMKVCHPLKPGFELRQAKLIILIAGACCAVLCIFVLVIMGPHDIQMVVNSHVVNVTICRFEEQYDGQPLQKAFSYILFAIFVTALISMFTFYILIARELRSFENRNSEVFMSAPGTPEARPSGSPRESRHHIYLDNKTNVMTARMVTGDRISTHMYKVFAIVTLIFILSYLPHLVVLVLQEVMRLDHMVLTYGQRLVLEIAYNSPYVSSVANPIVYGFSNAEFRDHCRHLLTCRRSRTSYYR